MSFSIRPFIKEHLTSTFSTFPVPNEFLEPLVQIGANSTFGSVIKLNVSHLQTLCVLKVQKEKDFQREDSRKDPYCYEPPFVNELFMGMFFTTG